jgi:hypothetical protein
LKDGCIHSIAPVRQYSHAVVRFHSKRGKAGVAAATIKRGKQAVKMTRPSCPRFRSNEVRLWRASSQQAINRSV